MLQQVQHDKKNMKHVYNILFGFTLMSLVACEGKTLVEKKIVNESSSEITFEITYKTGDVQEHIVEANSTVIISSTEELGGKEDIGTCTEPIEEIRTFIPLGRSLSFDPSDASFWVKKTERTKRIPKTFAHTCTLTIKEDDIQ
ncbi:MAG: hypothetical protein ACLGGV_05015 [Bacteroidia bacterium]